MVFSFVFTNCHLPSAILLCKKNGQSHDQPVKKTYYYTFLLCFAVCKYNALF